MLSVYIMFTILGIRLLISCIKKQIQVLTFATAWKIYSLSWVTPVDLNRWACYK